MARKPGRMVGILITILSAIFINSSASRSIPSVSVEITSADTGPGTTLQISARISRYGFVSLAASDGLVVTPSSTPIAAASLISVTDAVSIKNFISLYFSFVYPTATKYSPCAGALNTTRSGRLPCKVLLKSSNVKFSTLLSC